MPDFDIPSLVKNENKKPGQIKIVLAARISKMKNTLKAIEIVNQLKGDVQFDLWGFCEDSEYWKECKNLISKSPSNIKIKYCGEVEHEKLHSILKSYDLMFMPTRGENFGHAIVEALFAGLPVIISDQTPWKKLKKYGVGEEISLDNESGFIQTLSKFINMNSEELWSIKNKCTQFILDWKKSSASVQSYIKMIESIINENRNNNEK